MALRSWTGVAVFLGSYFPLSLILAFQDLTVDRDYGMISNVYLKHSWLSISFIIFTGAGIIVTGLVLRFVQAQQSIKIVTIKHIPSEMINYVFPYIVSFMGVSYDDYQKLGGFVIFMAVLFAITTKLGKVFVNPLLAVVGWRLYEISYSFPGDEKIFECQALAHGSEPAKTFAQGVLADSLFIFRKQSEE